MWQGQRKERRHAGERLFTKTLRASHSSPSIRSMRSEDLSHTLAAEIDRAASAANPDAEEVTIELVVSAGGRLAPSPRRVGDSTPYVDIKMTLRRVDPLEPLRMLLPEGWVLATPANTKGRNSCLP